MKKIITLSVFMLLLNLSNQVLGQTKRIIYVGFVNKDTVEVLEGESKIIEVFLDKKMTGNESVKISFKITDKDSLENKVFKILNSKKEFTFNSTDESLYQYLRIETNNDENEDNEYFHLELTTVNNKLEKDTIVLKNNKLVVKIKDKIPAKLTLKSVEDAVRRVLKEDRDTSEVIGTIFMKTSYFKTRYWYHQVLKKVKVDTVKRDSVEKGEKVSIHQSPKSKANVAKKDSIVKKDKTSISNYFDKDTLYSIKIDTNKQFKIDKVDILFKDGFAAQIKAYDYDNGDIYQNLWYRGNNKMRRRFGVSLRDVDYMEKYNHYYLMTKSKKMIKMVDLIDFDGVPEKNFPPSDGLITLTSKSPVLNLKLSTSLNSYINLNIYSDFLALLKSDRSNALIQSEFSSKLFLKTKPIPKRASIFLNYIEPSLKYRRFENGYESVKPRQIQPDTLIDRLQVKQRTYLEIGLKLNLFKGISRHYNNFEINTFTNFGWFNLQGDTLKNTQNSNTLLFEALPCNTIEFGAEIKWLILQYRNFGFTIGGSAMWQKIWNNKGKTFANGDFSFFFSPEYELFFFPIANSKDKIFLRAKYMTNFLKDEQNYTQLQFGYKAEFKLPNLKFK